MRTVSSSNALAIAALSLSAYVETVWKFAAKAYGVSVLNEINPILNWQAGFRKVAADQRLNDRATTKGISEFSAQLLKQVVISSSRKVRQVDFDSCSF